MDYLDEAKHIINEVQGANLEAAEIQADAQLAIACALVAQTELLTALIERLDALIDFGGGKSLYVTLTK